MIFFGIHVGHNESAPLMINGEIKFAVQEERFLNLKNFIGYPKKSIDYCLQYIKKKKLLIDLASFSSTNVPIFPLKYPYVNFFNVEDYQDFYGEGFYSRKINNQNINSYIKKISNDPRNNFDTYLPYKKIKKKDYFENYKASRVLQEKFLIKQSNNLIKDIKFFRYINSN
jgi:carbamoyltransferase